MKDSFGSFSLLGDSPDVAMTEAQYQELRQELRQEYMDTVDVNWGLDYLPTDTLARLSEEDRQRIKDLWCGTLITRLDKKWRDELRKWKAKGSKRGHSTFPLAEQKRAARR